MSEEAIDRPADRHVSKFERFTRSCGATRFVEMIGGRWKIQVVWMLRDGTRRFSELRRMIDGITEQMLAQQLRELEQDGFVARIVHPVIPPHVDYSLTEAGISLLSLLAVIDAWSEQHLPE